jgi:hypothetical protein
MKERKEGKRDAQRLLSARKSCEFRKNLIVANIFATYHILQDVPYL